MIFLFLVAFDSQKFIYQTQSTVFHPTSVLYEIPSLFFLSVYFSLSSHSRTSPELFFFIFSSFLNYSWNDCTRISLDRRGRFLLFLILFSATLSMDQKGFLFIHDRSVANRNKMLKLIRHYFDIKIIVNVFFTIFPGKIHAQNIFCFQSTKNTKKSRKILFGNSVHF